ETRVPWKEKFVKAWTNELLHLETTVTSRIEGSYATLKAYLQMSAGDLHHVYTAISLAGRVLTFALKKINDQYQKAKNATPQEYQEWPEFQQLAAQDTLKSFIDEPSMALQNPDIVHTKGQPSRAPNNQKVNSTKRDPSGFELVDPKARHCAICRQPRHNAHTCINKK
ncbi:1051_t:CDS:2, partial [Cetraspora pellucida]